MSSGWLGGLDSPPEADAPRAQNLSQVGGATVRLLHVEELSLIRRDDSRNAALIVPGIRIVWIFNNSTIFYLISGCRREHIYGRNTYIDCKGGQESSGRDIRSVIDTRNILSGGSTAPVA